MIIIVSHTVWRRLIVLMGAIIILAVYITDRTIRHVMAPIGIVTVMVDPGHGGIDGGCSGGDLQEKEINLWLSLKIVEYLKQSGVATGITRSGDYALEPIKRPGRHRRDLLQRVRWIEDSRAKAYISIHCDWSGDHSRQGAAVFYCYRSDPSKGLAEAIQKEVNTLLDTDQKAEPGNYLVLKAPAAPGALIEAGFLSNPTDCERLKDPEYRSKLAAAIARGVLKFLSGT